LYVRACMHATRAKERERGTIEESRETVKLSLSSLSLS
jgi:hypothetical protein